MRLHVLAGCRELLQPDFITPESATGLIGPRVRAATAFWISPKCGERYHAFLQDEPGDRRTTVMGMALKDEFGTRFEPLLVLPELLNEVKPDGQRASPVPAIEERRSQLTVLAEILACGYVRHLHLYGLAIPSKADPDACWAVPAGVVPGTVRDRIERLRAFCTNDAQPDTAETQVIEATPDLPNFSTFYNNTLSNHLVLRLEPRLYERGWVCHPETLAGAISKVLSEWNNRGIFPALPLDAGHLDAMTALLYERLLRE